MKKQVLCLSETDENVINFVRDVEFHYFQMEPLDPDAHSFSQFEEIYNSLKNQLDLSQIDLIIAENIEAILIVYFMRKDGFFCPAIFIPHTNAYPFNILFYFLLVSALRHPDDVILCGSQQAAIGYEATVNIKANPICTFGIKNRFIKGDKQQARMQLGLPLDKKILLYTGRFMNDKGLVQLLDIFDKVKSAVPDVILAMCVSHIDPQYYNQLAARLRDAVVFYRLEIDQVILLNQSSDLFVSVATSVFETYGKSPLEAMSCGVPVVVPNWDGFRYYVDGANGSLANVNFCGPIDHAPFSFAIADTEDFAEKCIPWLDGSKNMAEEYSLPSWAYYDKNMEKLLDLTKSLLSEERKILRKTSDSALLNFENYPDIIKEICEFYQITSVEDIIIQSEKNGLINYDHPGDLDLLKKLHDYIFKVMEREPSNVSTSQESPELVAK